MNVITVGSELGCFLSVLVHVLFELLVVCKEKSTVSIDFFPVLDYNIRSMSCTHVRFKASPCERKVTE